MRKRWLLKAYLFDKPHRPPPAAGVTAAAVVSSTRGPGRIAAKIKRRASRFKGAGGDGSVQRKSKSFDRLYEKKEGNRKDTILINSLNSKDTDRLALISAPCPWAKFAALEVRIRSGRSSWKEHQY